MIGISNPLANTDLVTAQHVELDSGDRVAACPCCRSQSRQSLSCTGRGTWIASATLLQLESWCASCGTAARCQLWLHLLALGMQRTAAACQYME